jgi:hypothetical protein
MRTYRGLQRHVTRHLRGCAGLSDPVELHLGRCRFDLVGELQEFSKVSAHATKEVQRSDVEDLGRAHEDAASVNGAARTSEGES